MDDDKPILPASKQTDMLMIAGWRLDEDRRRLEQGEESLRLEPKTTLLLGYLARHVGEPISREQLLAEVWPGVIVSDEVLTNAVNKIRRAFGDDRQNPKIIETIPKMGYRLIAEVVRVSLNDESQEQTGQFFHSRQKTGRNRYSWSQVIGGIILIGLLTGLGGYFLLTQPDQNRMVEEGTISLIGDKPSIAIMPFVNLGDDPYQDYFVDGITDDLITELAKNPKLLVIARDSTFFYKGQPLNISDLVSRLNVRYLLHGSVRRIEDSVRINAQLVDTANEALVWAERYDGSVDQIFKFQDEITGQIASALYAKVGFREQAGQKRQNVPALDAYDKFIYGRNRFYMYANRDENQTAREFYKDAIELDSNFAYFGERDRRFR
ncbi:MAG: winged helix-turn-helix domain-containing protein [Candidatus Thiodiazotropha endolucinida]|nr:winged helix-turn-helix domain-containing protein [Candidatus Thiodiazotropha taylori]MCW4343446.1 winged helix-turn-helix domain-containing protein [Candidatus Thiodiazotropha endolucinida]